MVIGIDLDDTINDLANQFIYYAKKYNQENLIDYNIKENEWDFDKAYGWDQKHEEKFLKTYIKEVLVKATVKKDASEFISKLKQEGHKIIIITARSRENYIGMYELTEIWLKDNNIKYDKLVLESENKDEKCLENNVDVFIDDSVKNCEKVYNALKIPTYMFDSIYNQKEENTHIKRVFSWKEIYKEIHKLV